METTYINAQQQAGADWNSDATCALSFGNPVAEYNAATGACALFDLSQLVNVDLIGDDRKTFLHNFCTNEIKSLNPGTGCEAFATNVKGRVLAHMFVFADETKLKLITGLVCAKSLVDHLDRYIITEDVTLDYQSCRQTNMFIGGPASAEHINGLDIDVSSFEPYAHRRTTWNDISLDIHRVDLLGTPGFLVTVDSEQAAVLWNGFVTAGIPAAGRSAFDVLRIEAGLPAYGLDVSDENIVQEVSRTSRTTSFNKGCYLGQEPIARLDAMGHVNRMLRGLRMNTPGDIPQPNAVLSSADDGGEVGRITSSARLSEDSPAVALAYLRRSHAEPGTIVQVNVGSTRHDATVFWPVDLE